MSISTRAARGTARLVFESIEGITNSVEGMHETIARHPLPLASQPPEPTRAHGLIAAGVYASIRGVTGLLREGVDGAIGMVPELPGDVREAGAEIRYTAALNGAFGDHLEATGNPLATTMSLHTTGRELTLDREGLQASVARARPHIAVLVHGLSLSELSWTGEDAPGIGESLQDELGLTPLYLRYNSGRHISSNGQDLSRVLARLCAAWPVPVESLSLIGHSMGGLVIRSACWYADQGDSAWLPLLRRVVCLGTPHHGSHVAKAGHALNRAMQRSPYTQPLAFGRRRSAGIKDLRHGSLIDEDWQDPAGELSGADTRRRVPLLAGVRYYFVAATLGRHTRDPLGVLLGDLLVRLGSAVGSHPDDLRDLNIDPANCRVFVQKNHFELLRDAGVRRQLVDWFAV